MKPKGRKTAKELKPDDIKRGVNMLRIRSGRGRRQNQISKLNILKGGQHTPKYPQYLINQFFIFKSHSFIISAD